MVKTSFIIIWSLIFIYLGWRLIWTLPQSFCLKVISFCHQSIGWFENSNPVHTSASSMLIFVFILKFFLPLFFQSRNELILSVSSYDPHIDSSLSDALHKVEFSISFSRLTLLSLYQYFNNYGALSIAPHSNLFLYPYYPALTSIKHSIPTFNTL